MEPANMHREHTNADPKLRGGVRWHDHADPHLHVPQPLWATLVGKLGNIIKHLRQVYFQSDQSNVAGKSAEPEQSSQSDERHTCARNPHRTCNCPRGACADDAESYRYARGPFLDTEHRVRAPAPNKLGNFRCPVSGKLCSETVCREWCEGSGSSGGARTETGVGRGNAQATNDN